MSNPSVFKTRNRKATKFGPVPDTNEAKRRLEALQAGFASSIDNPELLPPPTLSSSSRAPNRQEPETPLSIPDLTQSLQSPLDSPFTPITPNDNSHYSLDELTRVSL